MATTWLKSLHISKTMAKSTAISNIIGYVENPKKTDGGRLITSYACDSRCADEEFLLSKREYEYITGRNQGKRDVIAYHIRQAFKPGADGLPGEVDAETANKIGYELAMSFTKGNHSFIVCTHTDKKHIHNHIIFNSTTINCDRKFKDFFRSGRAVRRISDLLCVQYGLSVIENPKPSKGRNYGKWSGGKKEPTWQDKLRQKIDEILPSCTTFEDFIAKMISEDYTVNTKRKYITFTAPGQKKPTRLNTLKGDYTEAAIHERIAGVRVVNPVVIDGDKPAPVKSENTPSLLIDIQAKMREGKGRGYEQWSRLFNVKQQSKTLLFLKENGIESYEELAEQHAQINKEYTERFDKIKAADSRMKEIAELQKYIGQYGKTRDIYQQYKASGWDNDFYEANRADITLHRAAKKYFDSLKLKSFPKMAELKQEYATLLAEKKKQYVGFRELKEKARALGAAKMNAQKMLGIGNNTPEHENQQKKRPQSHEQK